MSPVQSVSVLLPTCQGALLLDRVLAVLARQEFDRRKHLPASFAATILREGRLLHVA